MIKFINVNKKFDDKIILEDINLEVKSGTILGLVGRNGSGKSTLLRLISGVLQADAGLVSVQDTNVYDNPSIKKDIFFVGDDPFFFSQATIKEMKRFYEVFYSRFDNTRYLDLLSTFELDESLKINTLSKGMKRQVSLIFALSVNPKILLLDEAFDGLDPIMRFRFKQILSDCLLDNNSTIIISSHNLRELEDICDSIAMIDQKNVRFNKESGDLHHQYHKFQIVFDSDTPQEIFHSLSPLHVSGKSRIFSVVLKGDEASCEASIRAFNPSLIERTSITLEEVFVYEMEGDNK